MAKQCQACHRRLMMSAITTEKKPFNTVKVGDRPPYIRDFIERGSSDTHSIVQNFNSFYNLDFAFNLSISKSSACSFRNAASPSDNCFTQAAGNKGSRGCLRSSSYSFFHRMICFAINGTTASATNQFQFSCSERYQSYQLPLVEQDVPLPG